MLPIFMINSQSIDVWVYRPSECDADEAFLRSKLSSDDIIRANTLSSPSRFIKQRAALRQILSRYCNTSPQEITLSRTKEGKPFVARSSLQFSISHSHNLWLCAVSGATTSLGVDLEIIKKPRDISSIVTRYFAEDEIALFAKLPTSQQCAFFYSRWTLKEAFLKAVGCGIAGGLDNLTIYETGAQSHAKISPPFLQQHQLSAASWQFYYQRLSHNSHFAACYQRESGCDLEYKNFSFAS